MRGRLAPLVALCASVALLGAACSDGDEGASDDEASDDGSTAVIVTTTTISTTPPSPTSTVPPETTDPPATTGPAGTTAPPATSGPSTTGTPTTDAPATTPAPTTAVPTTAVEATVGDPRVGSELVTSVRQPVDLAVRPGDPALHLVNQSGTIVRFDPATGDSTVTLDVSDRISGRNEQGLLGLEFSTDGTRAYINRTDTDGTTVVTEYAVGADGVLDAGSERVLLTVAQPHSNHNGGDLALGPDGMLYIPLGDGGSGGDPDRLAGDPTVLLGSLLRIDPTPSAGAPYTVPTDNPFAGGDFDGRPGAPEVWAWGLRNPWRVAFDPANGDLWIADVGQNEFEEVNAVSPGEFPAGRGVDFGWSAFEGTEPFNDDEARDGTTFPVLTYRHGSDGCSISGGAPYRGSAIPELAPAYVYSDYCSGIIWALDLAGGRNLTLLDGFSEVTAIRAGPDGELYVLERGGDVHRLTPA